MSSSNNDNGGCGCILWFILFLMLWSCCDKLDTVKKMEDSNNHTTVISSK